MLTTVTRQDQLGAPAWWRLIAGECDWLGCDNEPVVELDLWWEASSEFAEHRMLVARVVVCSVHRPTMTNSKAYTIGQAIGQRPVIRALHPSMLTERMRRMHDGLMSDQSTGDPAGTNQSESTATESEGTAAETPAETTEADAPAETTEAETPAETTEAETTPSEG